MFLNNSTIVDLFLGLAALPCLYYLIALFSSWRFFRWNRGIAGTASDFTPPISILKPVRGLDRDAYQNFASFCQLDYPDYELVFCVSTTDDPVLPVIEKLKRDFPEHPIRVLFGSGRAAANDKVAKLARLASEAQHEYLVINDSDVRVRPDYLRRIVAPLADASVGAVTCLYVSTGERTFAENLQTVGMTSDFYAGLFVARQLDGVKFALGPTIATTRSRLAEFGGYQVIEDRPADDFLVGRLIAEQGYKVELLSYTVETVADYQSLLDLVHKRLRWLVVMRHMRPWGHLGLIFTWGLPWSLIALALQPSLATAAVYLGSYLVLRIAMAWLIAVHGMRQRRGWRKMPLIPFWDVLAFVIWLTSFARKTIRWRGVDYFIREGRLAAASPSSTLGSR